MSEDAEVGRSLLRWYPPPWRARYGEELVALMTDQSGDRRPSLPTRVGVALSGLRERARHSGLAGDTRAPADRAWAGALAVLCGWTIFVLGGAAFQRLSEHFQQALPSGARAVPVAAFDTVVVAAAGGAVVVALGALAAMPAFVRYLRADGWSAIRALLIVALAATVVEGAAVMTLAGWAHSLTPGQRNGGSLPYVVAFLALAAVSAATLALWTALAVACARRLRVSPRLLAFEVTLAVSLFGLMAIMGVATVVWWASVATSAPWFLSGSPGRAASAFDPALVVSVVLMLMALATSGYGVARIARHRGPVRLS